MSVDLAVVGVPFLDLVFEGLPAVPKAGEELVARRLHVVPGGTGAQAVAAARLGLSVALVAPLATDNGGRLLRGAIEDEGVRLIHRDARRTAATALLSAPEGVAMASVLSAEEPTAEEVASARPEAVALSLGRLALAPPGARVYAVTGQLEAPAHRPFTGFPAAVHAFVANRSEAAALTGLDDPADAAAELAGSARTAVVTLGSEGAVAVEGGRVVVAAAPQVGAVDATGAGDLFVAAYVWADARGMELEGRLSWATLYAGLSVRTPTALEGALRLEAFLEEGRRRGLTPP